MAALTTVQLAQARLELGTTTDEDDLQERYDRLLSELGDEDEALDAAVTEVLRQRLADLIAAPASFNTPEYGQTTTKNIEALQAQIDRVAPDSGMSVVRSVLPQRTFNR